MLISPRSWQQHKLLILFIFASKLHLSVLRRLNIFLNAFFFCYYWGGCTSFCMQLVPTAFKTSFDSPMTLQTHSYFFKKRESNLFLKELKNMSIIKRTSIRKQDWIIFPSSNFYMFLLWPCIVFTQSAFLWPQFSVFWIWIIWIIIWALALRSRP